MSMTPAQHASAAREYLKMASAALKAVTETMTPTIDEAALADPRATNTVAKVICEQFRLNALAAAGQAKAAAAPSDDSEDEDDNEDESDNGPAIAVYPNVKRPGQMTVRVTHRGAADLDKLGSWLAMALYTAAGPEVEAMFKGWHHVGATNAFWNIPAQLIEVATDAESAYYVANRVAATTLGALAPTLAHAQAAANLAAVIEARLQIAAAQVATSAN